MENIIVKKITTGILLCFAVVLFQVSFLYATPPISYIDVSVNANTSDNYDYAYTLYYGDGVTNRGISHWWLEINCGHSSIDANSIYGYTMLDDVRYDWDPEFNHDLGQVGGYTDWVIKWNTPEDFPDIPKTSGTLIGYFGFYSTNAPTSGNWGAKGGTAFDYGTTLVPSCEPSVTPEPASMLLLSAGLLGLGVLRRRKSRGIR